MIALTVTPAQEQEMESILLEFGERHDLSLTETMYCVMAAMTHFGYAIGKEEYDKD